MTRISLDQANLIITAAFAKGKELGLKPLSVAVLDAGAHLTAFQRQDGSSNLRLQIATGKAAGALAMGMSSRKIGDLAAERPSFVAALGAIATSGVVPTAGGVIVVGSDGAAIGAVGVTGDTSDNDELCALAGIAAAGLTAQG
ncbi:GlcG/HbpS family heme-binding protein [Sphingomonas sp.]|uniref:GlcG/HbpS family heme-binding protein n=1 Tax=Sphingomonas sp. TaxID=28214 RepID=UPI002FC9E9A9